MDLNKNVLLSGELVVELIARVLSIETALVEYDLVDFDDFEELVGKAKARIIADLDQNSAARKDRGEDPDDFMSVFNLFED